MVYKSNASALLGAAEYIIKYKNLYDQWIVTSTIEACIVQKYPDVDHNSEQLASSIAGSYPICDTFTIANSKGIYRFKYKRKYYRYFYGNPNDHDQAPSYPDNNIDRQKMVDKQASLL